MPDEWTEGLIYMIPKTDARCDEISKWRPITLLNDIYKIVAKTTTNRMRPLLPSIIHDTQSGFLQDRSIFDNIFLFWEMTALAQHHKQSLAILLLDFEKAYDKVDWDFLEVVLLKLGFPCVWIKDVSYGERTKDNYGSPAFALINNATRKVLKHGKIKGHEVCSHGRKRTKT